MEATVFALTLAGYVSVCIWVGIAMFTTSAFLFGKFEVNGQPASKCARILTATLPAMLGMGAFYLLTETLL